MKIKEWEIRTGFLLIFSVIFLISCKNVSKNTKDISIPKKQIFNAERFSLERKEGYTQLKIFNPWQGADNITIVYRLQRRNVKLPPGIDPSSVIFVPVKKIVCMSTTHVAMISALGEEKTIAGVSGKGLIYSKRLIERIKAGFIEDVGYDTNLNKELILKISPDLVMMYGIGGESDSYTGKIKELGIKVVFDADYLERDPLSKAEWIKVFGALYCKEGLSDSIYLNEVKAYNAIKKYVSENISNRPKVLLGLPYKDTWYISPGNSFINELISDAGGEYLWKDTESAISMPYGIENVYMRAIKADFWLNISTVKTRKEISAIDPRLALLPCFKNGNLYNNNNRITIDGGNDYWESGTVYPHQILQDMASIFHPDLFKDHTFIFYRKIF